MRALLLHLLLQPAFIAPHAPEIIAQDAPVIDEDGEITGVLGLHVHLLCCDRLLRRGEDDVELAVGLKHGVFHARNVENALIAQLLRQLVEREAVAVHGLLGDAAALDDEVRPAVEQLAQVNALVRQAGEDQLTAKQHQQRYEPIAQRQGGVLQRDGCDVRDEHGHHQLGQLQFSELPLAHEAHGHNERKKNNQCPDENDRHEITTFPGWFSFSGLYGFIPG